MKYLEMPIAKPQKLTGHIYAHMQAASYQTLLDQQDSQN